MKQVAVSRWLSGVVLELQHFLRPDTTTSYVRDVCRWPVAIGAWSANLELRAPEKQSHVDPVEIVPEIKRRDLLGGLIHEHCPVAA
jgi:hypothetical protein